MLVEFLLEPRSARFSRRVAAQSHLLFVRNYSGVKSRLTSQGEYMSDVQPLQQFQAFTIRGDLQSASFLPWVIRHSQRLGVTCQLLRANGSEAIFRVDGQRDLVDAFEVGCLLGPFDVWVETITRRPLSPNE